MDFFKKFLLTSSVLGALCAFTSGFAAGAQGSEKSLELSVEWSALWGKDMPELSVSSPLAGNETSLRVEIRENLLDFIANYNKHEGNSGFFRKVNNLRDV